MNKVKVEISESLYHEFVELGKQLDRDADDLIRAALVQYRLQMRPQRPKHSIVDIPSMSLGDVSVPWTSRAEMLEDFFDRRD
jgi:hypothetical protein